MADLQYTVDIDTRGARGAINNLRSTILNVGAALGVAFGTKELVQTAARFEDLRTTLGFLFGDIRTGAQAFEQIKKFATESIFTVEDLTASVVKLKAAGLTPTIEQLRLFSDVASVSSDSVGTLQAITDLFARTTAGGLGLEDLNRLADRGIPVFQILSDKLGITRLEVSKFGQTAEGAQLILRALTEGLQEAFGGASTARANNLTQAFSNLEDAIANTADIIGQAGLNKALGDLIRNLTEVIESNKVLIKAIGETLVGAISFAVDNLKYLAAILAGVFAVAVVGRIVAIVGAVYEFTKALKAAAVAGTVLQGVTGIGLLKVGVGLAAAAKTISTINELTDDTSNNLADLEAQVDKLAAAGTDGPLSLPSAPTRDSSLEDQLDKLKNKQNEVTKSTVNYFARYRDGVNDMKLAVEQERELLKLTESEANIQRELNQFTKRYFDTIRPLQEQVTQLKLKDTEQSKVQAKEIERQIGLITNLYESSKQGLETELRNRELIREQTERQLELDDALTKRIEIRRDLTASLQDKVRESKADLEKLNLTPFQQELKDITTAVDDDLVKAIRKVKEQWEDGLITSDQYLAEIEKLKQIANSSFKELTENAKKQREIQRSFAYGWKRAFESYQDDATNAAKAAERIFDKTTKGMEDMIVNFAKTGKFEFKGFINSILEEMLRSQIQQIMAKTFGGIGGGGGANLFSSLGSFLGFANGGIIPTNGPVVVGERGPELLSGASGRSVTPNNQLGGEFVTYNINAVDARSFKELVAQDPSFIHAVAMQGSKAAPSRR